MTGVVEIGRQLEEVELIAGVACCGWCGRASLAVNNRPVVRVRDLPVAGRQLRAGVRPDRLLRQRTLARLASAKHGLQGRNWVTRYNYGWVTRLGVYRLSGTVRPTLAFASR